MIVREFLDKIADLFGRKNWADFSTEENHKLRDLFENIDSDAYSRGLEENQGFDEADVEASYDDGWNAGYDEGYNDARNEPCDGSSAANGEELPM